VAETANQDEHKAILGFNVDLLANAETELENADVKLFTDEVIYQLIEDYETYVGEKQRAPAGDGAGQGRPPLAVPHPPRPHVPPERPAVVGVEVISGTVQNNRNVGYFEGNEFERVGQLSGIQKQGDDVDEARAGERVSIAIDGPTVGRDIEEGDTLWTEIPENAKILEQELKRRSRPTSARRSRRTWRPSGSGTPSGEVNRGLSAYSGEKMPQFVANLSRRGPRAFA